MKYVIFLLFSVITLYAQTQTECVASVIIREAGGEGEVGMRAVASVIQNRGHTSFKVVSKPKHFSSVNDVIVNKKMTWARVVAIAKKHPQWSRAIELARNIESRNLPDITGGATHFYSGSAKPYWARSMVYTAKIGGHLFLKEP